MARAVLPPGTTMASEDKWMTGLPADATVADAARVAIASRTHAVVHVFPQAVQPRDEDIEHVHRLRVATRRAGSVLRVYRDVFPVEHVDKLSWMLGRVRRAAGPARDLDVLLERLVEDQAPESLVERLRYQRTAVQGELERAYEKTGAGRKLRRRAEKLTLGTPTKGKKAKRLARALLTDWGPKKFDKAIKAFLKNGPVADAPSEALHQFRISGKRLRYTLEALSPALSDEFRGAAYAHLKEVQDRLGRMNDHDAAAARMSKLLNGADARELEFLKERIRIEQAKCEQAITDFHEWWEGGEQLAILTALRVAC